MRGTQNDIVMFELFELSGKEVIGIFTDKEKLRAMEQLVVEFDYMNKRSKRIIQDTLINACETNGRNIDASIEVIIDYLHSYAISYASFKDSVDELKNTLK